MNFLFRPIDISSLIFFRIVFGILAFADVMGSWAYKHFYKDSFNPEKFQFKYYGFEWVQVFSEPFMSLFFISLLIASIFITIGKWYRGSMIYFALGFTYLFLMEKNYYLNHGYLFCVLSYVMIFLPVNRAYSVDALKNPLLLVNKVPYCFLFVLQFSMGVVYFFGGIAKINQDWLHGLPLKIWLENKKDMPIIGDLISQDWVAYFMSYGGLLLDLFVVFFLMSKRTRKWALAFVLFFHLTNMIIFKIGIFPFLSVALTLLFFEPDFPRTIFSKLSTKIPNIIGRITNWWQSLELKHQAPTNVTTLQLSNSKQSFIILGLSIFCLANVTIPLRHHFFKGDVTWTEEGHRYSWRMMLRTKSGYGRFIVKDLRTGKNYNEKAKKYIESKQAYKMHTHPDMILQFAHYLEEVYRKKGIDSVAIYANIKVAVNGRKYQQFIYPKVDLTKVKWQFLKSADWIVPLTTKAPYDLEEEKKNKD